MRIPSSLVAFALYLSLAAAVVIPNAGDITSRDTGTNAGSTGESVTDGLTGDVGTVGGTTLNAVVPAGFKYAGIKAAGGKATSPENGGSAGTSFVDSLAQSGGTVAGSTGEAVLPQNTMNKGIEAAGGEPPGKN
ncbi:hypothetical protein OG21DRAFT_1508198 [Imleria badia]|nr:hypothetical protein OG21DRAFT_1508198 [Imleria badia]